MTRRNLHIGGRWDRVTGDRFGDNLVFIERSGTVLGGYTASQKDGEVF